MSDSTEHLNRLIATERAELVVPSGAQASGWASLSDAVGGGAALGGEAAADGSSHVAKILIVGAVAIALGLGFTLTRTAAPEDVTVQGPEVTTDLGRAAVPPPEDFVPTPIVPAVDPARPEPTDDGPIQTPVETGEVDEDSSRSSRPRTRAKPAPRSMEDELALLERAKAALNRGDAKAGLAAVNEHQRDFPRGMFVEEREAMRVEALCQGGQTDRGRRARARFLKRFARSPFVDRVKGACP